MQSFESSFVLINEIVTFPFPPFHFIRLCSLLSLADLSNSVFTKCPYQYALTIPFRYRQFPSSRELDVITFHFSPSTEGNTAIGWKQNQKQIKVNTVGGWNNKHWNCSIFDKKNERNDDLVLNCDQNELRTINCRRHLMVLNVFWSDGVQCSDMLWCLF
jgi:hypothetical protein